MSLNTSSKEVLVTAGGRVKMQTKTNIFNKAESLNQEKTASQLIAECLEREFGHLHLPKEDWPSTSFDVQAKQCPNCLGIIAEGKEICPNCNYSFKTKKVKKSSPKKKLDANPK